jgi:hypothetical protein
MRCGVEYEKGSFEVSSIARVVIWCRDRVVRAGAGVEALGSRRVGRLAVIIGDMSSLHCIKLQNETDGEVAQGQTAKVLFQFLLGVAGV